MLNPIWIFLPAILFLGIITSYTDIKYRKIKNKWIIAALLYAFIGFGSIVFFSYMADLELNRDFFVETLLNFIISIMVGVIFWLNGYWSAADAKLFSAFAILTPLSVYSYGRIAVFPALNIVLLSYLLIAGVLLIEMARKARLSHLAKSIKSVFKLKNLGITIAALFVVHWFGDMLFGVLGIEDSLLMYLLFTFAVIPLIRGFIFRRWYIVLAVALSRFLLDDGLYSWEFVIQYVSMIAVYLVVDVFKEMPEKIFTRTVTLKKLKPGMQPTKAIVIKGPKVSLEAEDSKKDRYMEISPEGITAEQISELRSAKKNKAIDFSKMEVYESTCFGPYIFAGTMLTIIGHGNIFIYISTLLA
jgi:Flp pilus assembly protein protease CpaA